MTFITRFGRRLSPIKTVITIFIEPTSITSETELKEHEEKFNDYLKSHQEQCTRTALKSERT